MLGATLTIVASFLPLAILLPGTTGEFIRALPLTVSVALVCSYAVEGTRFEATDSVVQRLVAAVRREPGVRAVGSFTGGVRGGGGGAGRSGGVGAGRRSCAVIRWSLLSFLGLASRSSMTIVTYMTIKDRDDAEAQWTVAEAKARSSEVITRATAIGPQRITRNGRPAVVVVAVDEWERKTRRVGTLADFFAASPLRDSGLVIERYSACISGLL